MDKPASDRKVADPLSSVARGERRALLVMNVVVAAMAYGGVVPSEVQALGLRAEHLNQEVLLAIACVVTIFLLVAFLFYVSADLKAWRAEMFDVHDELFERMMMRIRRDGPEVVRDQLKSMMPNLSNTQLSEATSRAIERMTGPDSTFPLSRRKTSEFWPRYSRPYRWRMLFDVHFTVVLSLVNLIAVGASCFWPAT